ncbi:hypothetical protein SISNIDRAFT_425253 [Sistotremastrum niveocremeum HHB9708]|uniref:Trypsin-like serine protease n=1 Tax=Sistotremastrum niveocremeum HHB9708 TaxID=1314777 RepID=A0A164XFA3_9AGAM|nr:hypothetical protein SISNIDRAFT_425253 [Sistotremastrum niveocremeum HHB9708]
MEEIRRSSLLNSPEISSSSFIITPDSSPSSLSITPVLEVLSSMPRSDLVLLSARVPHLPSLPVSPYPARPDDPLHIHVVSPEPSSTEYVPWLGEWRSWQPGQVLGYRDFAGREAQPGTYDALSHMLFKPIPTQGSSGGPIIGENGSVIGIVSGSRMDNSVEGIRGWGTPSEAIYEVYRTQIYC